MKKQIKKNWHSKKPTSFIVSAAAGAERPVMLSCSSANYYPVKKEIKNKIK